MHVYLWTLDETREQTGREAVQPGSLSRLSGKTGKVPGLARVAEKWCWREHEQMGKESKTMRS